MLRKIGVVLFVGLLLVGCSTAGSDLTKNVCVLQIDREGKAIQTFESDEEGSVKTWSIEFVMESTDEKKLENFVSSLDDLYRSYEDNKGIEVTSHKAVNKGNVILAIDVEMLSDDMAEMLEDINELNIKRTKIDDVIDAVKDFNFSCDLETTS